MNIHPTSIISKNAKIGKNVFIGPFCNLQKNIIIGDNTRIFGSLNAYDCSIGTNCKIGTFVEVQNNVTIGNNCKIQSHTFICEGVRIEDGVFVAHNTVFINDKIPRATNKVGSLKAKKDWKLLKTKICFGASIGSGAVVFPINVGKWAMVGAGAVVTEDVPDFGLVYGIPARLKGFVCKCGTVLKSKKVKKENSSYVFLRCENCHELIPVQKKIHRKVVE
jgi:acetyltransferase-like isoleucine patch superfamily enzyme